MVIDIGTSSVRAGYAGDDSPKAVIPSAYGYLPAAPDADVAMEDPTQEPQHSSKKYAKLFIGQSGPSLWRDGMQVANPLREGLSMYLFPI